MNDDLKSKKVIDMTGEELAEIIKSEAPDTGIGLTGFFLLMAILLAVI